MAEGLADGLASAPVISPEQRAAFEGARIVSPFDSRTTIGAPRSGGSTGCASGGCSSCVASAAAPAVDGVYVTDQLRDPEGFGERIDDGKLSREEAIAAGLLTEDGEPVADAPLLEDSKVDLLGALRRSVEGAREVHPEPRQDAAVFGAPTVTREAESETYRAAVRAEAAMERGDRG